jgi:hypothetical protein
VTFDVNLKSDIPSVPFGNEIPVLSTVAYMLTHSNSLLSNCGKFSCHETRSEVSTVACL